MLIQDIQQNANESFKDINEIVKGGSIRLSSLWNNYEMDLYSLESKNGTKYGSVQFYGITQDLEKTNVRGGNLRDYLRNNFNKIS
ncbi:hypothetical protein Glove_13g286 [Diversispora epigaea]|uniref:Uncharacterized protein n=1 Tax=Diversispora epigaea TaxID=1348612 RepID=A0A397JXJ9_9GLOM|nr:hypothetical protein Glove_13g286 [Diversispora epigaea]